MPLMTTDPIKVNQFSHTSILMEISPNRNQIPSANQLYGIVAFWATQAPPSHV